VDMGWDGWIDGMRLVDILLLIDETCIGNPQPNNRFFSYPFIPFST
jgi:hypothetical protein